MNTSKKRFNPWIPLIGLVALFVTLTILFLTQSFSTYSTQLNQQDWKDTKATVSGVTPRRESTGSVRHSSYRTVYDASYIYTVNGENYSGKAVGLPSCMSVGDAIEVKYNPDMPGESTHILTPQTNGLISSLLFAVFIVAMMFFILKPLR